MKYPEIFYDESDMGTYEDLSGPIEYTQEPYSSSDAPIPQGQDADSLSEPIPGIAETLDEDLNYLFNGELDSPAQSAPLDWRDNDIDTLAADSRVEEEEMRLNADDHGSGEKGKLMMTSALPFFPASRQFRHDEFYRHQEYSKDQFSPSVSESDAEQESLDLWPTGFQHPERPEVHDGERSRSDDFEIGSIIQDAHCPHSAIQSVEEIVKEPLKVGEKPSIPETTEKVGNKGPSIRTYDPWCSLRLIQKQTGEKTPTNSDLERDDYQFYKITEKIKSKHTRQALQNVDPKISRQELFRIYRRAVEEDGADVELYRPDTPLLEYDSDELEGSLIDSYDEDVSSCDEVNVCNTRRKSSCRASSHTGKSDDIQRPRPSRRRSTSANATYQSLMHSKPYLSEITPVEAQSQHPSVIPRSLNRSSSRAGSLSSETRLKSSARKPELQPLTEDALAKKDRETSFNELHSFLLPEPSSERQPRPFRRPTEPASIVQSSPLGKCIDSTDALSTKAMIGSTAPTPSRPDTPRPLFATPYTREGVDGDNRLSLSQRHSQSAQVAESSTQCLSSHRDVNMLDLPFVESSTPTKSSINLASPFVALPLYLPPTGTPHGTIATQQSLNPPVAAGSATITRTVLLDERLVTVSSDIGSATLPSVAATFSSPTSTPGANIMPQSSPLQPLPGMSLQETLASVLAKVDRDQRQVSEQHSTLLAKSRVPDTSATPFLDDPWHEPMRAADNLSHQPSGRLASPSKQSSQQSRRSSKNTGVPSKKPSDPFLANSDVISLPPTSDTPPLFPLTGIAGQIYQCKRGQKKATTPGRLTSATRAVSARSLRKVGPPARDDSELTAKIYGKRSKSANLGLQGDHAKVTKTRSNGVRSMSHRASTKTLRKIDVDFEGVPDVPPLPTEIDIDMLVVGESISQRGLAPCRKKEAAPSTLSPQTAPDKKEEMSQAMDLGKVGPKATPDILEQLEHKEWVVKDQPGTITRSKTTLGGKKEARNDDATKTPTCTAPCKQDAELPQEMDIDPPLDAESEAAAHSIKSLTKCTPTKRIPTPRWKKKEIDEIQVPKTPSRSWTAMKKTENVAWLTPQSAEESGIERMPTRRSPRLIEKGRGQDYVHGHRVM